MVQNQLKCTLGYKKWGFTLVEMTIALVIAGVVASLAFSNFGTVLEKSRAREGEEKLQAVFVNVQRVKVETGTIAGVVVGSTDPFLNDLRPSVNFLPVNVSIDLGVPSLTYTIVRNPSPSYTLSMQVLNTTMRPNIVCSGGPAGLCAKLGY